MVIPRRVGGHVGKEGDKAPVLVFIQSQGHVSDHKDQQTALTTDTAHLFVLPRQLYALAASLFDLLNKENELRQICAGQGQDIGGGCLVVDLLNGAG